MGEVGRRRRGGLRHDWQGEGESRGGALPADAPCLEEAAGTRTWRRRSDGGMGGGGGGRSGGGGGGATGRTGNASRQLSAVTTGRGSCSRLLPACRVFQRKPRRPLCRNHHRRPAGCHMTGSRCGTGGEVGVSDWLSS